MRARARESELVEAPPRGADYWFSAVPCRPLPASVARSTGCARRAGVGWNVTYFLISPSPVKIPRTVSFWAVMKSRAWLLAR
jgi:hypothetical protein